MFSLLARNINNHNNHDHKIKSINSNSPGVKLPDEHKTQEIIMSGTNQTFLIIDFNLQHEF